MAKQYYPRALSYVARINEASARGKPMAVSASGPWYALAQALASEGLVQFGARTVRNHVVYYELTA